jgi:cytochrome c553
MSKPWLSLWLVAAVYASSPAFAQDAQPSFSEIAPDCESCHGPKGNSLKVDVPRLNGQPSGYLTKRLFGFLNVTNQTPHATNSMWQKALSLGDPLKIRLADYFAQQAPTLPRPGPLAARGKAIYERGIPDHDVAACQQCHGSSGEGQGAFPRIAGQHSEYIKTQLWAFNFSLRVHGQMTRTTQMLRSDDIEALASYLSAD